MLSLRTPSITHTVIAMLVVVVETAVIGYWITTGATVIAIGLEMLVVGAAGVTALAIEYRQIDRQLRRTVIAEAAARERTRIANDMHDTLGHQLSLIALRASALEVCTSDSAAQAAAHIRRQADDATAHLHHIIEMLRPQDTPSITEIIQHARDAGVTVTVHGSAHDIDDPRTAHHVQLVVREGLTNAMRHAPGQPVDVDLDLSESTVTVSVRSAIVTESSTPQESVRRPMGLRMLDDRIRAVGGTVCAGAVSGVFVLTATLPRAAQKTVEPIPRTRRPLRVLMAHTAIPLFAAGGMIIGFYAIVSHDAVMEQSTYRALALGATDISVVPGVPPRQAPVRLIHPDPHPAAWLCRYYTDGNFPLAIATFEICTDDGTVVRTTDLRNRRWN